MRLSTIISFLIQILTLIIVLYKYKDYKSKFVLYLCCLLITVVGMESYGQYQVFFKTGKHTMNAYNLYVFIEFIFIVLMYKSIIKSKKKQQLINILSILFLIIYSASFFISGLGPFHLYPLESFVIAIIVILYLMELLQSDKILDYRKHLPFWVSVAFFIFYLSSIPFFAMLKYMQERNLFYILSWLNIFMYSTISFGLLWSNTKEKY